MGRAHLHAQRVERRAAYEHSAHAVVAHAPARRHIKHLRPPIPPDPADPPIPPHPAHSAGERRRAPRGNHATGGTRHDRWHGRSLRRSPTGFHPAAAVQPRRACATRRDCARAVRGRRLRAAVRAAPRMDAARIRSRALVGSARPACARHGPLCHQPVVARRATVAARRLPHGAESPRHGRTDQRRRANGRGGPAAPRSCARAPPAPRRSRPCLSARRWQQITRWSVGAGCRPGAGRGGAEGGGRSEGRKAAWAGRAGAGAGGGIAAQVEDRQAGAPLARAHDRRLVDRRAERLRSQPPPA
jgi:hypothetical protein